MTRVRKAVIQGHPPLLIIIVSLGDVAFSQIILYEFRNFKRLER